MKIEGAHVFVTGGNRGIGLALAKAFASAGARVWIGVRSIDSSEVKAALGEITASSPTISSQTPIAQAYELDLSSRSKIEAALPDLLKLEIDVLVNNAGQLTGGLLEEQALDDIYSMYQVNLLGLTHLMHAILPGMISRGRGKIVNNASVSGVMNFPMASTYSASKTGVIALTACVAGELRGTGVSTLTLVTPGVKTRMFEEIKIKYGAKMDLSFMEGSLDPDVWAREVVEAVLDDRDILNPRGVAKVGLSMARYLPGIFNAFVATKFHRRGRKALN